VPSHAPEHAVPSALHDCRPALVPVTGWAPIASVVQFPSEPVTLHAWHWPVQGVSQQ